MKKYIIGAFVLLCSFSSFAQVNSVVNDVSLGLYSTGMDNTMSVTGWNSVDISKFLFGAAYGLRNESTMNGNRTVEFLNQRLYATTMAKIKDFKLGVAYKGVLGGDNSISKNDNGGGSTYSEEKNDFNHTAQVLFGIPLDKMNIGVRGGLVITGRKDISETKPFSGSDFIEKIKPENTLAFTPQISVGINMALPQGFQITPAIHLGFGIKDAGRVFSGVSGTFSSFDYGPVEYNGAIYQKKAVYRMYSPTVEIGSGVNIPLKDETLTLGASATYIFGGDFMPEKYEYYIINGTETHHKYKPDQRLAHTIRLHSTLTKQFLPNLKLTGRVWLEGVFDNNTTGGTRENTTSQTNIQTTDRNNITVTPRLYLVGQYDITPKFSFVSGIIFTPVVYEYTKSHSYAENGSGNAIKSSKHIFRLPELSQIALGIRFTPLKNLDIQTGVVLNAPASIQDVLNGTIRLSASYKM